MTIKITKIKSLKGLKVPIQDKANLGNVGIFIEDFAEQNGAKINRGVGPDWHNVEIKTKNKNSTSANTIATMTRQDIINTPYEESAVCAKFQQQFRNYYDGDTITESKLYDFNNTLSQATAKWSYEEARKILSDDSIGFINYVRGTDHRGKKLPFYFELKNGTSYSFRISPANMRSLEHESTFAHMIEVA